MAKLYDRRKKLRLPVFHWTVDIVMTKDVVKYAKSVGWEGKGHDNTTAAVHLFFQEAMTSMIILPNDVDLGEIVHEIWHAVYRMLTFVGVELDNEVVAYHLGYLTEEATKFAFQRKRKKNVTN